MVGGAQLKMPRWHAFAWVGALLVCVAVWLGLTVHRPLILPDEPREGAITIEMARSGDLIVPRLNGEPFVEKPPLMYVLSSAFARVLGSTSPWVLRLPHTIAMLLTLWIVYALGRRAGGHVAGLASACVLFTTNLFAMNATKLVVDSGLMAFTSAGIAAAVWFWLASRRAGAFLWAAVAAGSLALAVSTKGPAALLFPLAALAWLAVSQLTRAGARVLVLVVVGVLALLPLAGWALALDRAGGRTLVEEALVRNSWGRFARGDLGHKNSPLYYLTLGPGMLVPWTLIALAGLAAAVRSTVKETDAGRATALKVIVSWAVGSVILLSIPAAKRGLYALPLMPAWSLIGGWWLAQLMERDAIRGLARACVLLTAGFAGVGSLAAAVYLPTIGWWWGALAAIPGVVLLTLAFRRRFCEQPACLIPAMLVAIAVAGTIITPPLLSGMNDAEKSIELAHATLTRARAETDRVRALRLSERGRSVVSLSLGEVVAELPRDNLEAAVPDGKTLLITECELSESILAKLTKCADVSQPARTPIGHEWDLLVYTLTAKQP